MATLDRSLHLAASTGERVQPDPGLIWFTEECVNNGAPLERYVAHAERIGDEELATFFRRALDASRQMHPRDRRRWARRRGDRRLS